MHRLLVAIIISLSHPGFLLTAAKPAVDSPAAQFTPSAVFRQTNIWSIHLHFTPDQWAAMEPKQNRGQQGNSSGNWLQGPEGGRNGYMAAQGISFDYVHADLDFGTQQFKQVGVRYKGNGTFWSSQAGLKRSFKIDLNQFAKGQNLGGMSQLNLHNSIRDGSGLNEALAYRLFREGGVPAPRTAYARVRVTVPGAHDNRYFGLYDLVEDIGGSFIKEHFHSSKGALLKPVTPNLFSDLGDDWKAYNQTYDPKGKLSEEQKQRIIGFCKFTTTASPAEFASRLGEYVDLDNLARYLAITAWLSDVDGILGPGQNFYVYLHPQTQKFIFIPWDQDQSFGQFPRGSQQYRENLSIYRPWIAQNSFLEKVFAVEAFKKAYLARMREFNATLFQPARIASQVDELAGVIREALKEESAERSSELEHSVAGAKVTSSSGPGSSVPVNSIKPFTEARFRSVQDQLDGKAPGPKPGQSLGR